MSLAAQVRVRTFDPFCRGPFFEKDLQDFRQAISAPWQLRTRMTWSQWYEKSFAVVVADAFETFSTTVWQTKVVLYTITSYWQRWENLADRLFATGLGNLSTWA